MICSGTGAQVGLLTKPLASSLCCSLSKIKVVFCPWKPEGIFFFFFFLVLLLEYEQFLNLTVDPEPMLHVEPPGVGS